MKAVARAMDNKRVAADLARPGALDGLRRAAYGKPYRVAIPIWCQGKYLSHGDFVFHCSSPPYSASPASASGSLQRRLAVLVWRERLEALVSRLLSKRESTVRAFCGFGMGLGG